MTYCTFFVYYVLTTDEDCKFALEEIRNGNISAEEFDIYWRQCAQHRFKEILESKSTNEIFELWPQYTKPSGSQLVRLIMCYYREIKILI